MSRVAKSLPPCLHLSAPDAMLCSADNWAACSTRPRWPSGTGCRPRAFQSWLPGSSGRCWGLTSSAWCTPWSPRWRRWAEGNRDRDATRGSTLPLPPPLAAGRQRCQAAGQGPTRELQLPGRQPGRCQLGGSEDREFGPHSGIRLLTRRPGVLLATRVCRGACRSFSRNRLLLILLLLHPPPSAARSNCPLVAAASRPSGQAGGPAAAGGGRFAHEIRPAAAHEGRVWRVGRFSLSGALGSAGPHASV